MTDSDPESITNRSGGADLNAGRDLTVGGDVVGRDKINTIISSPSRNQAPLFGQCICKNS